MQALSELLGGSAHLNVQAGEVVEVCLHAGRQLALHRPRGHATVGQQVVPARRRHRHAALRRGTRAVGLSSGACAICLQGEGSGVQAGCRRGPVAAAAPAAVARPPAAAAQPRDAQRPHRRQACCRPPKERQGPAGRAPQAPVLKFACGVAAPAPPARSSWRAWCRRWQAGERREPCKCASILDWRVSK